MQAVRQHSMNDIQDEVRALVDRGSIARQQCLYELCNYFRPFEWQAIERTLEANDFLLRDHVIDLLGQEDWRND